VPTKRAAIAFVFGARTGLSSPRLGWRCSRRDPRGGFPIDEEEDVEALQRDRLDGEEVDREHALGLLPQEGPPGQGGALAGRADLRLAQDLSGL
jgi:hypothetical protein